MEERLVSPVDRKEEEWYAFVPGDPLIFGHILLTVDRKGNNNVPCEREGPDCIHDMWEVPECILEREIVGVRKCMNGLLEIDNVKRIYLVVAGETDEVHHHFHLLPRYGFKSFEEREKWYEELKLKAGDPKWRNFYRWPTLGMAHKEGFQYLGELERAYGTCKDNDYYPDQPSDVLLEEMARKIKAIMEL